jgi:zinc protease
VLATLVGRLAGSRLNLYLRETQGATYGVQGRLRVRSDAGELFIRASVQNDRVEEALRAIRAEFERLARQGPDSNELSLAKAAYLGRFAAAFETTSGTATALREAFELGLAPDHFATLRDRVRTLDRQALLAAARRCLDVNRLGIAVYGSRWEIESQLNRIGNVSWYRLEDPEQRAR